MGPLAVDARSIRWESVVLNVLDCVKEFDRGCCVKRLSGIPNLIQTLEVRWKLHALPDEQDKTPPVECHRSADLNEHVRVEHYVLLAFAVCDCSVCVNMNNRGAAAAH